MKKIMLLGCLMCSAFAWANVFAKSYEWCVTDEQATFNRCTENVGTTWGKAKSAEPCAEAYKYGLAQCKEVYINKGK
jgi:hypothetical protein